MTLRRALVLTTAAALLLAGCAADPEAEAPPATDVGPEDVTDDPGADEPATDDPPPATSELAQQWAAFGMPGTDDLGEQLDAMSALLPPEMPVPSDGDPFPLLDPGFNSVGMGAPDDPMSDGCAGNILGAALAEGSQEESDLAAGETWFEQQAADNGWTVASSQQRWSADDPAWEYGARGTVYRIDGHGQSWNVSVTLNPYAQSVEYCPVA